MLKDQRIAADGESDLLPVDPPAALGAVHRALEVEHDRAAVAGPRAADGVVRKELVVGESGQGLEVPDVAAFAAVVEGEPQLVDAHAGEHHLTQQDRPRPERNGQRDVAVGGPLELRRVREPVGTGDGERQGGPHLGGRGEAFGVADAYEVQAVESLEAQRRRGAWRGRRGGREGEREEQRQAAHDRACGFASATSMISRCSSWATPLTAPGAQNVSPSLSVRRSPISSIGWLAASSSISRKAMRENR